MKTAWEEKSGRYRLSDWLKLGMTVLTELGPDGVTIEELCRRAGKTKGSFYHHFADRDAFVEKLLGHWQATMTDAVILDVDREEASMERLKRLMRKSATILSSDLERHIRAWAMRDARVAHAQARVDERRVAYMRGLIAAQVDDEARAEILARLMYAVFVGGEQIHPRTTSEEFEQWFRELQKLYQPPKR